VSECEFQGSGDKKKSLKMGTYNRKKIQNFCEFKEVRFIGKCLKSVIVTNRAALQKLHSSES
jgi:hypothetical protein